MNGKTSNASRPRAYVILIVSAFLVATIAGGIFGEQLLGSPANGDLQKRMREFTDVVSAASYWSAEDVGTDKLVYASIDGMLRTLDPHSSFLQPSDYTEMQDRHKGTFYGLGILVTKRNDQVTVITPLEGTPAARLGIRAGDIISEVEGQSTEDLALDEVVRRLKGPKGTVVNIKILRIGIDEPIPMTIVREAIPTNSISYALMLRDGIGYIRIKDFTYTTVRELDQAVEKLQTAGMQKLILDLRMNPGGLLDAAVGVTDHFIDKGQMVVYTRGRTPDASQEFYAPGKHDRLTLPLVILINRGSASASEIVAGAVQDHDRGLVIGETSWGKGLVQSVYTLQYGAGLALTTSKYFTPAGRNIQRDYSSVLDYYMVDEEATDEIPIEKREVFKTDTGRKVYGGGGITPDVVVKPNEISRVAQLLEVRSAMFNFAVEYAAKHPEVTRETAVTEKLLEEFAKYAESKEIASVTEVNEALARPVDRDFIQRTLRAEIVAAKFGYDASYPIRLEGDAQVSRAIELLPEAQKLAAQAVDARSKQLASGAEGGAKRASSNPRNPN